jgi:hypothetical protein
MPIVVNSIICVKSRKLIETGTAVDGIRGGAFMGHGTRCRGRCILNCRIPELTAQVEALGTELDVMEPGVYDKFVRQRTRFEPGQSSCPWVSLVQGPRIFDRRPSQECHSLARELEALMRHVPGCRFDWPPTRQAAPGGGMCSRSFFASRFCSLGSRASVLFPLPWSRIPLGFQLLEHFVDAHQQIPSNDGAMDG